eukprot:TRINITY_DN3176_c0_g1_i2.p1 TRINITY_DN3176_c0_g1~~TRINITY_DN3176_c0_g1_i2.p1  ORF type:complete len:216 (+),score=48.74 TRINITY_DN3176_c0_g1_i2:261-908(+)
MSAGVPLTSSSLHFASAHSSDPQAARLEIKKEEEDEGLNGGSDAAAADAHLSIAPTSISWLAFSSSVSSARCCSLASYLHVFNVFCILKACERWQQLSVHASETNRVLYIVCERTGCFSSEGEAHNGSICFVVPVHCSVSLSLRSLKQLSHLPFELPGAAPPLFAWQGGSRQTPPAGSQGPHGTGSSVYLACIDRDGLSVFLELWGSLAPPHPLE